MKFKEGDKVRCVEAGLNKLIEDGKEYTVGMAYPGDVQIVGACVYSNYRFELVDRKLTLEEEIELAKSYIGKTIKSTSNPDSIGEIQNIRVIFGHVSNHDKDMHHSTRKQVNDRISTNGYAITLGGIWDDGRWMNRIFSKESIGDLLVKDHETVKINGYRAVDMGPYYEFGCAKIDKSQLKDALVLMSTGTYTSNKSITSVTIGVGTFTKQDLEKLVGTMS